MKALYDANPGVLFGSEVAAERYIHLTPLCQWLVHDAPGLQKNCFDPNNACMRPSHLRRQLYGEYARFCAHLFLPAAVPTPDVHGPSYHGHEQNRFQKEMGVEKAFKRTQAILDQTGCIKNLRLNYREYGIDDLTRKEIEKLVQ